MNVQQEKLASGNLVYSKALVENLRPYVNVQAAWLSGNAIAR